MQFGVYVPNFRSYADPHRLIELAREAESAGWDGIFIWDHVFASLGLEPGQPTADPWVALAAMATATERLRLGPLVTPIARRRPWKVARELVTLDHLSGGRVIFGAGLGLPVEGEFEAFGENPDARTRADKLDEGLDIITRLLSGDPLNFEGEHFKLTNVHFGPKPVQERIPVWVAATCTARRPQRRAARWDGVIPMGSGMWIELGEFESVRDYIGEQRDGNGAYDLVTYGFTASPDDAATVAAFKEAGATWWLEQVHDDLAPYDAALARIKQGPPRV